MPIMYGALPLYIGNQYYMLRQVHSTKYMLEIQQRGTLTLCSQRSSSLFKMYYIVLCITSITTLSLIVCIKMLYRYGPL